MDSTNFSPFELNLLVDISTAVNRLSNAHKNQSSIRLGSPILPSTPRSYTPPTPPLYKVDIPMTSSSMADAPSNTQIVTKTFARDECDKRFENKRNLARHLMLHKNERKHVCTVCDRAWHTISVFTDFEMPVSKNVGTRSR
jgi:hypothetical protein